jgi:citrate synthase
MCDRVEALVAETSRPRRARDTIVERSRRGEALPGFGHVLYPGGDPRARPLLDSAFALDGRAMNVRVVKALVHAMEDLSGEAPTIDLGLVALAAALGLPPGSAAGVFALGRTAGWIAHALEQRATGTLLRPRALYVGA